MDYDQELDVSPEFVPAQKAVKPAEPLPQMSDDEVLAYTRGIRIKVVQDVMADGKAPTETGDRILLSDMLKGLESGALASKKIASDEKQNSNTAAVVAELLRNIDKNTAFTAPNGATYNGEIVDVTARMVPLSIPDIPALPGEMDVAPPQMDYNTFVRLQGKDVDQIGKDVKHQEAEDDDMP